MTYRKGDILRLVENFNLVAQLGALVYVEAMDPPYVNVRWLDDKRQGMMQIMGNPEVREQRDGSYSPALFAFVAHLDPDDPSSIEEFLCR